jgi:hypothetical protein
LGQPFEIYVANLGDDWREGAELAHVLVGDVVRPRSSCSAVYLHLVDVSLQRRAVLAADDARQDAVALDEEVRDLLLGQRLGSGRIVVSEIEVPIIVLNLV